MHRLLYSVAILAALLVSLPLRAQTAPVAGPIRGHIVFVPGEQLPDGFSRLGSFHKFHTTPGDYLHGVLLVKSRRYHDIPKNARALGSGSLSTALARYGVRSIRAPFPEFAPGALQGRDRFGLGRMYEISYSADVDPFDVARELALDPDVEYAEPLFVRRTTFKPDDVQYATQYALQRVQAELAWDVTHGDTSIVIGIVDSGVDWEHEDLAANIWTNPGEIPGNGKDDDQNGKVDDIHGWDFVGNVASIQALLGQFVEDNNPKVQGTLSMSSGKHHGTHCAGIAAAVTNNDRGVAGLGFNSRILPVKIGSDAVGAEQLYRGYEGIVYAARQGAKVISCSWGGGAFGQAEQDAIGQALAMGSVVIAAAGNDASNNDDFKRYPSSYTGVFSVGATDSADHSASFSNFGITASVFAPGNQILSTFSGDKYSNMSGTSMSTPLVSGLAALLRARHTDWTPEQVMHQIRSTADNVITLDSLERPRFFGRINARRALETNNDLREKGIPGIGIVDQQISSPGGIITDHGPQQLRFTLKNYLAGAKNLRVSFLPFDDAVTFGSAGFSVDTLASLDTIQQEISVSVAANPHWFEGSTNVLVKMEADGYVDYALIEVPFKFESDNEYKLLFAGLPGKTEARAGMSPNPDVLWAVGYVPSIGGGYARYANGAFSYNVVSPTPLTTVFAFDGNRAMTASGTTLFKTTNGGTSWTNTSLGTFTSAIRSIHFFDQNNGIVVGDPLAGHWGIATTTDGGTTWTALPQAPPAEPGQQLADGSVYWPSGDNHGWFGTPNGDVFRTSDRGATWTGSKLATGANISRIAFTSSFRGVALYRMGSDSTAPFIVATSNDWGATWSLDQHGFGVDEIRPVHLSGGAAEHRFIIMGNDGRIMESETGESWTNIASFKTNGVIGAGATGVDVSRLRIWNLGTAIGYLDLPIDLSSVPIVAEQSGSISIESLSPNPGNGMVSLAVTLASPTDISITLVNTLGENVGTPFAGRIEPGTRTFAIDVAALPAGTYFCVVSSTTEKRVERLIVE